jgi:hypothetical protein
MRTLTPEELQSMGMTLEQALGWVEFYRNEVRHNPSNGSAKGRIALMEHAAKLLGGG